MSDEMLSRLVHANPRQAEIEALFAVAPHLKKTKREIMLKARAARDHGLIPDEVPGLINTVRRRFTDLWKEGLLKPTDRVRKNARGNHETVWVEGKDENAIKTQESKDQKIKRLEARVVELEGLLKEPA